MSSSALTDREFVSELIISTLQQQDRRAPAVEYIKGQVVFGQLYEFQTKLTEVPVEVESGSGVFIYPDNCSNQPLANGDRVLVETGPKGARIVCKLEMTDCMIADAESYTTIEKSDTTWADAGVQVVFQAPASGRVKVKLEASTQTDASDMYWRVYDVDLLATVTDGTRTLEQFVHGHGVFLHTHAELWVQGLSPGQTYTWKMQYNGEAASGQKLWANATHYGPIRMEIWAMA